MFAVLREEEPYPYLMRHAVCRLRDARESFAKSGMAQRPLIHLGGKMWALFPWLGSYAFLALERFLKIRCGKRLGLKGLNPSRPYYLQFTMQAGEEEFYRVVTEEAEKEIAEAGSFRKVPEVKSYSVAEFAADIINEVIRTPFTTGEEKPKAYVRRRRMMKEEE